MDPVKSVKRTQVHIFSCTKSLGVISINQRMVNEDDSAEEREPTAVEEERAHISGEGAHAPTTDVAPEPPKKRGLRPKKVRVHFRH